MDDLGYCSLPDLCIGFFVTLEILGISLSSLAAVSAVLMVGIVFGLTIFGNLSDLRFEVDRPFRDRGITPFPLRSLHFVNRGPQEHER